MSHRTPRGFWAGTALAYRVLSRACQRSVVPVLFVAMMLPGLAQAAGWWTLDKGTSNFARGGANITDPREPIALHVNPAALAGVDGLQLVFDADMVFDRRAMTRAPDDLANSGTLTTYETVQNDWAPIPPSPSLFAAYNFAKLGLPKLTLGAGVWGPPRVDHIFPKDGPQRYSEIEYHALQMEMGLGVAYELPWYNLRIGVTGILLRQTIDTSLKLNLGFGYATPENPRYDGYVYVRAVDPWIPTAIFGLSGSPLPRLTLAVVYQLAYDVHADGETKQMTLESGIAGLAEVTGQDLGVDLHAPALFRAAAGYSHPDDSFAVELDFVWEQWSRNKEIVFHPRGIAFVTPMDTIELTDIVIQTRWRDTYSVRLGGQYRLLPELLLLRAGAYYERAAVPKDYVNAFSLDLDKVGATVGARVDLPWGLFVDVAGGYVYWVPITVKNSKVLLVNPLTDPPTEQWPTGNGDYKGGQILAMIAVGAKLDL